MGSSLHGVLMMIDRAEQEVFFVTDHRCNGVLTHLVIGVDEGDHCVYKLHEV